ncbi:MAG: hypothetical protein Q9173_001264 [Seirophora scorigena]
MDLWHGHIAFDDGQQRVQDVHFSHPRLQDAFLPQNAPLHFLAIVEAASVPLYLAAGPSLDVWTSNETTRDWLYGCVTEGAIQSQAGDSGPQWIGPGGQSRYGILLGVKDRLPRDARSGPEITEVLLYATASRMQQANLAPPSPPASSSPGREDQIGGNPSDLRLYALPLSSKILSSIHQISDQQQPGARPHDQGHYLPTPPNGPSSCIQNTHAPKRPKIETLFTDAAQNRRQQQKRGGEGFAKAMAGAQNGFILPALPSPTLPNPVQSKEKRASVSAARGPLSRCSTTGSIISPRSVTPTISRPPTSRRPTLTNGQRSSLHRVESVLSPSVDGNSSLAPEEGNSTSEIEQQNKASLSRIIMTGMRMYGFQPQRKKSISNLQDLQTQPVPPSEGSADDTNSKQDEYKAVYHQTFKAVSFVFRAYWARRVLSEDMLRDTVDGFLGKFCEDPYADPVNETLFDVGDLGSQKQQHA